jgi:hypothetical protein
MGTSSASAPGVEGVAWEAEGLAAGVGSGGLFTAVESIGHQYNPQDI